VFDVLDDARVARDPTAPVENAVAALAARPGAGSVSTPAAEARAAVLAGGRGVAAPARDAAVPERRVALAERRRQVVVDEVAARGRALRRLGRHQRHHAPALRPVVTCPASSVAHTENLHFTGMIYPVAKRTEIIT